jgi:putative tricarboxylic transport membrane protein
MKFNDAIWGALCIALGALVLWHVQSFPAMPGQKYGPAVFPGLIAAGFVACGLILCVRGAKSGAAFFEAAPWTRSHTHLARALAVLAAMALYALLSPALGFLLTALALLLALFKVFGVPTARAVIIAALATILIHTLFYKFMRVPLPWGVLTPIAW